MRALARRFGEDQDRWALAGLFHDLDQDRTGKTPRGMPTWPRNGCGRPAWRGRWSTPSWPTPTSSTVPT
jgi:hypothetical protein